MLLGVEAMMSSSIVSFDFGWTGQISGFSIEGTFSYDASQSYPGEIVREEDLLDFDLSFFDSHGNLLRTYEDNHLTFSEFNFAFDTRTQNVFQDDFLLGPEGINIGEKTPVGDGFRGLNFWSLPRMRVPGGGPPPHVHFDDWGDEFGLPFGFSDHGDVAFFTRTTEQLIATGRVGAAYSDTPATPLSSFGTRLQVAPAEPVLSPQPGDLAGSDGDDALVGMGGRFLGLAGNDLLYSNGGASQQYGGAGEDGLYGSSGDDLLYGGAGRDRLYGNGGNDQFMGGAGADEIYGANQSDSVLGGLGNDLIYGNEGHDILYGGGGNDRLYGGGGDDILVGGSGNDMLYGNHGSDLFVFRRGDGTDIIMDFQTGVDKIGLMEGDLVYGDLSITQDGLDTLLGLGDSGETLAVLKYTQALALGVNDFTIVATGSDLTPLLALR